MFSENNGPTETFIISFAEAVVTSLYPRNINHNVIINHKHQAFCKPQRGHLNDSEMTSQIRLNSEEEG